MKSIKYKFRDISNLDEALTHSSYVNNYKAQNYERLEFLGDRVLGLIIASKLYTQDIKSTEGDLAKKLAYLVCKSTLKKLLAKLNLKNMSNIQKKLIH